MSLAFDLDRIATTEFGVGRDLEGGRAFTYVPADTDVAQALREMVQATWEKMQVLNSNPATYDPSEKYASEEYTTLSVESDLVGALTKLHGSDNLPSDATALGDPDTLFCYFVRLVDNEGRRLTAVRRTTQFKGVVKKRLVRVVTDAVKLVEGPVFRLDADFDVLIDAETVHVLRPSGFEFVAQLQQAIMEATSGNIEAIRTELDFVDFGKIETYAAQHPRAARYLASIRASGNATNLDKRALKKLCRQTGVSVSEVGGKLQIEQSEVLGFLEVLDRRRYELELVQGSPERYRAASRQRIRDAGAGH